MIFNFVGRSSSQEDSWHCDLPSEELARMVGTTEGEEVARGAQDRDCVPEIRCQDLLQPRLQDLQVILQNTDFCFSEKNCSGIRNHSFIILF
jgi:hypothetical protein